jgi:hypothetical protein
MNTLHRLAVLAALLCAAACSSPITQADEAHTADQPSSTTSAADSSASRGGGNLMGGN